MKRKSVALIAILSMMLSSITACGSKADEASKESSKESQVVVESSTEEKTETHETSETVVETEPTIEPTAEPTEEVTETKLKVEIIENRGAETIISITNISDESYFADFSTCGVWRGVDLNFEPGETLYGVVATEQSDSIAAELEQCGLMERVNEGDTVCHLDTFTEEQFADAIALVESFMVDNSPKRAYNVAYYNNDTFLGTTDEIWVDDSTHELSLFYEEANKIVILWVEQTFY